MSFKASRVIFSVVAIIGILPSNSLITPYSLRSSCFTCENSSFSVYVFVSGDELYPILRTFNHLSTNFPISENAPIKINNTLDVSKEIDAVLAPSRKLFSFGCMFMVVPSIIFNNSY